MITLLLAARKIWRALADYPAQGGVETPAQTIARMQSEAVLAEENRAQGGRTEHHVRLMHELHQARMRGPIR